MRLNTLAYTCLLLVIGCKNAETERISRTTHGLREWANAFSGWIESKADDPFKFKDDLLAKYLEKWEKQKIFPEASLAWMRSDAWDQPFVSEIVIRNSSKAIKIISRGPNKKYEFGYGDDLWVEVVYFEDGKIGTLGSTVQLSNVRPMIPRSSP